ncbi:hypothetical protein QTP86_008877 [Hemibagrus guttatus]|nr:hypothetical protein QTP86_008877 [Hemibagrus guttatus]
MNLWCTVLTPGQGLLITLTLENRTVRSLTGAIKHKAENDDRLGELHVPTLPCKAPLRVTAVDNCPIGKGIITRQTGSLTLQVGLLISSPANPIIHGFPWLQRHDPLVSWKEGELT